MDAGVYSMSDSKLKKVVNLLRHGKIHRCEVKLDLIFSVTVKPRRARELESTALVLTVT